MKSAKSSDYGRLTHDARETGGSWNSLEESASKKIENLNTKVVSAYVPR